jgi:hypothetical protein
MLNLLYRIFILKLPPSNLSEIMTIVDSKRHSILDHLRKRSACDCYAIQITGDRKNQRVNPNKQATNASQTLLFLHQSRDDRVLPGPGSLPTDDSLKRDKKLSSWAQPI